MTRTLSGFCCILVALTLGLDRAAAQPTPAPTDADKAMDTLREGIPSDRDNHIVDDWINQELNRLSRDVENPILRLDGIKKFESDFKAQYNHERNSGQFKQKLAEQMGVLFLKEFKKGQNLNESVGRTAARVLLNLKDFAAEPAMLGGLESTDSAVRYLCAKSLVEVQSAITADATKMQQVADAVAKAGAAEVNGVVVAEMYQAVAFADNPAVGVTATLAILDGRLKNIDAPGRELDRGELPAIEFLDRADSSGKLGDPDRQQIVRDLAKLLRIHTERFAEAGISEFEHAAIAATIERCETLIKRMVKPATSPDVTAAVLKNDSINAQIELLRWIGSPDTPGVLNAAPWSVPVGAK